MTDADVIRRRELVSATLRTPNGIGLVADLTGRLENVVYSTRTGLGYEALSATVLSSGLLTEWPEAELSEAIDTWGLCRLELCEQGEVVWAGRVADIKSGELFDDLAFGAAYRGMAIECDGAALDLAADLAVLPSSATVELGSMTLSALLQQFIPLYGGMISAIFGRVGNPGVDVGPMSDASNETALDVISRLLKAGSTDFEEWTFLAYWQSGAVVPILQSRDSGIVRWSIEMLGTGLRSRINLRELATRVSASYSDESSSQRQSAPSVDTTTEVRYGLIRHRVISLDRVNAAGAATGIASYLAAHIEPVGPDGTLTLAPEGGLYAMAPNAESGLEPCWRVRAGDIVNIPDFLPASAYIARREWGIDATRRDVDAGTMEITLDQRRLMPRQHENQAELLSLRRALEPTLNPSQILTVSDDTIVALSSGVAATWNPGVQTFILARTRDYELTIIGQFNKKNSNAGTFYLGFALDGEVWDPDASAQAKRFGAAATNLLRFPIEHKVTIRLAAGTHTINVWSQQDTGSTDWYGHALTIR